jgi:hypothetical protein
VCGELPPLERSPVGALIRLSGQRPGDQLGHARESAAVRQSRAARPRSSARIHGELLPNRGTNRCPRGPQSRRPQRLTRGHGPWRSLPVMNRSWDATAPGILRLPSGRLVRGRGLRRPLREDSLPELAIYLLGDRPPPVPWDARWVRWPDFRLPSDRRDAQDALREAWRRAEAERVEVACGGGAGEAAPLSPASRCWTACRPARQWPLFGSTTSLERSRRRGSDATSAAFTRLERYRKANPPAIQPPVDRAPRCRLAGGRPVRPARENAR